MTNIISLKEAADEIYRTCQAMPDREPFFILVGAGLSAPSIKTAAQLVDDFVAKYNVDKAQYDLPDVIPPSREPIDLYSFWFEKAYPQPILRRNFLKDQMQGKPPSPAVLRLAHLLSTGNLSRIVVTPNFDDLLYQALLLFGSYPVLCDHPATISRVELDNVTDIQLIHVHGTYNFYDSCNLRDEVAERSIAGKRAGSMAFLLDQLLGHRSPVVIGYSGWEHDVIMNALSERLKTRPASYIYWFCHTARALRSLPPWLLTSDYVRFIVPNTSSTGAAEQIEAVHTIAEDELDARDSRLNEMPTLSAVDVLDLLNERFAVDEPILTLDPFEYLARRLDPIFKSASDTAVGSSQRPQVDHYDFYSVVRRLRHAAEREKAERKETESTLEEIRNLIRRSRYKKACTVAASTVAAFLSVAQSGDLQPLKEFFSLFNQAVSGADLAASDSSTEALWKAGEAMATLGVGANERIVLAEALLDQAKRFSVADNHSEPLPLINRALVLLAEDRSPQSNSLRLDALLGKGTNLLFLDHADEDGYAALDEVIAAKGTPYDERLIAHAYLHKARSRRNQRDFEGALDVYDAMIKRFKKDATVRPDVVSAILAGARTANRAKLYDRTLKFTRVADTLLKSASKPWEIVALKEATVPKGIALRGVGKIDEALSAFDVFASLDALEKRFAPALPRLLAMWHSGRLWKAKGDATRARDYYSNAVSEFGDSRDEHVQKHLEAVRRDLAAIAEG